MRCLKEETRTIFNLFKEYRCEDCPMFLDKEEIKIGKEIINIYYMGNCLKNYNKTINLKRSKLLFKDIIMDSFNKKSNNIFLWLDIKDDLSSYYEFFEGMINLGFRIHIII